MSRIYGEIRQLGYVVHDIEKAMRHWVDVLGVGPWFYIEKLSARDFLYRGQPSEPDSPRNNGPEKIEVQP